MGNQVYLREVGLRDGLQMVTSDLPTDHKLEWIRNAVTSGVSKMEVTTFVPSATFPIFSDAAVVASHALGIDGLQASALAVNLRGAEDAMRAGFLNINYVLSASEAHSKANVKRTTDEALEAFARIVDLRDSLELQSKITLSCGIATSFGCSIQGVVHPARVLELAEKLVMLGADEVMLADTIGYANPAQVETLFSTLLDRLPNVKIAAHFHDTRGLGLANIAAATRAGVRRFDASLGGLGGCPYAPGATGNVNFEDAAFMLESMGFDTGIDIVQLLELRQKVSQWLPNEPVTGAILRAGLPKTFLLK